MCLCCGCFVNKEPLSKRAPPNLADSGNSVSSGENALTQQPGANKLVAGSVEQKTKK